MTNELTQEQKDELVRVYSHLTKAKESLWLANDCAYLVRGAAAQAIADVVKLQEGLERVLISGELPPQPAPVVQRNFIGQKRD